MKPMSRKMGGGGEKREEKKYNVLFQIKERHAQNP